MEILSFSFDDYFMVSISINLLVLPAIFLLTVLLSLLIKKCALKLSEKNIDVDEIKLGIGQSSITVKYNNKERQIAYKLWVELNTRKIGLEFDEKNDVIIEIYNSWYQFFYITREMLKEIPENRIESSVQLIELITDILNIGLRPHLTKWQADFRQWYGLEKMDQLSVSPQELQRKYQHYDELVNDLKRTNQHIIEYKNLLKKIAFERE